MHKERRKKNPKTTHKNTDAFFYDWYFYLLKKIFFSLLRKSFGISMGLLT